MLTKEVQAAVGLENYLRVIFEARGWLTYVSGDAERIRRLSDEEALQLIQKHYYGGLQELVVTIAEPWDQAFDDDWADREFQHWEQRA